MTRINTNVPALLAVNDLSVNNQALSTTLQRLSSGLRINKAGDDPSGLIISELLRGQAQSLGQAVSNSQRASNVLATAEGGLNEVSSLLTTIKSLTVEAAGSGTLTPQEIKALQTQIDSAVESITRIANATAFGGTQLLDGSLDYVTSGVSLTNISDLRINAAQFGTARFIPVSIQVASAANPAALAYMSSGLSAAQDITLEVSGKAGVQMLSFAGSTHNSAIAFAINSVTNATGVTARLSGGVLVLNSVDVGSSAFVSVTPLSGSFDTVLADNPATASQRDSGTNVVATINGSQAVGSGNEIRLNTDALSIELTLNGGFVGNTDFAVTSGGALFQLGSGVTGDQQVSLGIPSANASNLGSSALGYLSDITMGGRYSLIGGNAQQAGQIVDQAIQQVATMRGRLGAFDSNTVQTNINSLKVAQENATAAESAIRDADFATETSNLTREQILVAAGTSVLTTANATPQAVLKLLR